MTVPRLAAKDFSDGSTIDRPLLLLGPSLGTDVETLWTSVAAEITDRFHVIGFDLPGHGRSEPATGFDVLGLTAGVLSAVDALLGEKDRSFHYAGDSVGGAIGLQLLLDVPQRVSSAILLCTGPKIGVPAAWRERAAAVRDGGTEVLLESAPGRWFGPGFVDRDPATAQSLLDNLRKTDADSYAAVCDVLAAFDVRDRLHEIATPVLAVAGEADLATPVPRLRHIAEGVQHGRLVVLDGVAHLAPAERPDLVADLIVEHAERAKTPTATATTAHLRAAGMRVRREVLGDAHVDRASAQATAFTTDFQEMITQYAWGGIWTRPGLDRRSRSLITLTALVARGHHEELAMHLRAARTNGLTEEEIRELLLQTAIYCGVPDANTAFRIAQRTLAEIEEEGSDPSPNRPSTDQRTSEE